MKSYVYAHFLPATGEVIYIGMGKGHRAFDTHKRNEAHLRVLRNLEDAGYTPLDYAVIVTQGLTDKQARQIETRLIKTVRPALNHQQLGAANAGRGEENANAVLNAALVSQIREQFAQGVLSIRGIARSMDLKYSAVRSVIVGKTWSHI